jgi:hypothetical protein
MFFSASHPGVVLIIGFQSSTGSTQELLKVTCNLGILVEQLTNPRGSGILDAHWRERIGFFLPEQQDYWWLCSSAEDARRAGQEIATLLEERALPVMESLASPIAIAALWASGQSPGLTERQRVENLTRLTEAGVNPN